MEVEARPAASPDGDTLSLDAFAFAPMWRSKVTGLGGEEAAPDPSYVFHTTYVQADEGPAVFTIRFEGLSASSGLLLLAVNAVPHGEVASAYLTGATHVALVDVVASGGETVIAFQAESHATYALLGNLHDETDADAAGVTVTLRRGGNGNEHIDRLITARRTVFGVPPVRPVPGLIASGGATLADPVSQMCTAAQFEEAAYAEWLDKMKVPATRHRKQWEFVYILQVLHRHGMLQPGMRGLGFGVGTEPLPAVMAAMGCTIVATDLPPDHHDAADWSASNQHGASVEALRRPEICPDDLFDERVSFRAVDMTAVPADLLGFDFTWSSCAYEHLGSIPAGLRFVEDSISCLKPGGIAVHTTEFNLSSNHRTVDQGSTVLFRRRDLERLAQGLQWRGHEVSAFKYDQGDLPQDIHIDVPPYRSHNHLKLALSEFVTTSFGIVIRRGQAS